MPLGYTTYCLSFLECSRKQIQRRVKVFWRGSPVKRKGRKLIGQTNSQCQPHQEIWSKDTPQRSSKKGRLGQAPESPPFCHWPRATWSKVCSVTENDPQDCNSWKLSADHTSHSWAASPLVKGDQSSSPACLTPALCHLSEFPFLHPHTQNDRNRRDFWDHAMEPPHFTDKETETFVSYIGLWFPSWYDLYWIESPAKIYHISPSTPISTPSFQWHSSIHFSGHPGGTAFSWGWGKWILEDVGLEKGENY